MVSTSSGGGRRLRVLYVCPLAHLWGHQAHAAVYETAALARANQDVTLLTFAPFESTDPPDPNVKLSHVLGPENESLRSFLRPLTHQNRYPELAILLTLLKVPKLVGKTRYDVIHLRDGDGIMPLPQVLGFLFGGRRWLISLLLAEGHHSLLSDVLTSFMGPTIYRLSFSKNEYGYVCQNENVFSYYSNRFMKGLLVGKVYLLPPLVPKPLRFAESRELTDAKSKLGIGPNQHVLLSFGALHVGKDIETVLSAMNTFPELTLIHAGLTHGRLREQENRNSGSRMIVKDSFVPENSKPIYFGLASAVILSYTREFTGTASMLWEACRYQVPVIASNNRQLAELVCRYKLGVVFQAEDSESLRDAIKRFFALTPKEMTELKRNCERFSNEFSSASWAEKCLQIYNELCDG